MEKQKRDKIKLSLLTVLCNATGIYRRTIKPENKDLYRNSLKIAIKELIDKVDNNSIKNKDVREAIRELSNISGVSIGASQKAINVYLKFYCVISDKDDLIIGELDCPIDRKVINKNRLRKIALKDIDLEHYTEMQEKLRKRYDIRILADIEAWDSVKGY